FENCWSVAAHDYHRGTDPSLRRHVGLRSFRRRDGLLLGRNKYNLGAELLVRLWPCARWSRCKVCCPRHRCSGGRSHASRCGNVAFFEGDELGFLLPLASLSFVARVHLRRLDLTSALTQEAELQSAV